MPKKRRKFVSPKIITVSISLEAHAMAEEMKPDYRHNRSYVVETALRLLFAQHQAPKDPDGI